MNALMARPVEFGAQVRSRRVELGLTLAAVADRAGMHLQSLAKIENGLRPNPTWETVIAISKALDVTPDYFLPADEPPADPDPPRAMGKRK